MARYNRSTRGLAMAAYRKAKNVENTMAPEIKAYTIDTLPNTITALGNIFDLVGAGSGFAGVQQGVAINDRTGDSIHLRRFVMRGIIKRSQTAAIETVRMIIFRGNEGFNGLVPAPGFILEAVDVYSSKNQQNRYVTKTLYDEVFTVDNVAKQYHEINLNIKLDWDVQFETGIPVPSMGGLYMLLLGTTSTVANQPQWEGFMRISYTDA